MKSIFYIADDIQTLQSGKLMMVGVYADHIIIAHIPKEEQVKMTKETPGAISQLCVVITVTDITSGDHQGYVELLRPDGSSVHKQEVPVVVFPGHRSFNLILRFAPFQFIEAGTYTLRTTVGEETVDDTFQIVFQDPGTMAAAH